LVEGIRDQRPSTVGLPIEVTTISLGKATAKVMLSSADSQTWTRETAHPQESVVPSFRPGKVDHYNGPRRSARQLFK
jgi:hypothetical protein